MRAVPFTRIAGVLPLVHCLEHHGAPVERLARRAGVPSRLFDQPEAQVPMHLACRFYGLAARELGDECLGAEIGTDTDLFHLGTWGRLLQGCATLHEALLTSVRLTPYFASGHRDWIEEERDRIWLCQGFAEEIGVGRRQVQAFVLEATIRTLQRVIGEAWAPTALRLPDYGKRWTDGLDLDSELHVDAAREHVGIAIPRRFLHLPLPPLSGSPKEDLEREIVATSAPRDFVESLCLALRSLLPEGCPRVELVAEAAGTSPRTLQRRLAEEGLTFSKLLENCRLEVARELLQIPHAHAIDVAYEVGYSDPGNFSRAFRRVCGVTPRQYQALANSAL